MEDYILDGDNGFLLKTLSPQSLIQSLNELNVLSKEQLEGLRLKNYTFAQQFTYAHYNTALKDKILNVRLR
jgi:predicted DNA binding CopG/RHH family protein